MRHLERQLDSFLQRKPRVGQTVYLAPGAVVLGDVEIGEHASIWFHAVLRGDINRIVVGHHTNIQDQAVLHVADDYACLVGNYVTVGHSAIIHACTVGDGSLIGMGAVILDGAVVGRQCLVGAKTLITQGAQIPDGSLVLGSPGRVVRLLTDEERQRLHFSAEKYVAGAAYYKKNKIRPWKKSTRSKTAVSTDGQVG